MSGSNPKHNFEHQSHAGFAPATLAVRAGIDSDTAYGAVVPPLVLSLADAPRVSADMGVVSAPRRRTASMMPGNCTSSSGLTHSGVWSLGEMPVPPVVMMSAGFSARAAWSAAATGAPSATTCGLSEANPRVTSQS